MRNLIRLGVLLCVATLPLQAATLRVANNGEDAAGCGSASMPCRSITTAIDEADDGDVILVDIGRYTEANGEGGGACDCMILIDKSVRIESIEGPDATVLDAEGDFADVVQITADGATFGRRGRGFTLTSGDLSGLFIDGDVSDVEIGGNYGDNNRGVGFWIDGNDHHLQHNRATDNDDDGFLIIASDSVVEFCQAVENDDDGFDFQGDDIEIKRNVASSSLGDGFVSHGARHVYEQNLASANDVDGFFAQSGGGGDHTYIRNVSSGNFFCGFYIQDPSLLQFNAAIGNDEAGIFIDTADVVITQNNLYGNDEEISNCGLINVSGDPIVAPLNFWGAAAGPGINPADDTCGDDVATAPSASSRFGQPLSFLPLP